MTLKSFNPSGFIHNCHQVHTMIYMQKRLMYYVYSAGGFRCEYVQRTNNTG
jgi:hypothetical protein